MSIESVSKFEKLTIYSYETIERSPGSEMGTFEALINPSSYIMKCYNNFSSSQGINTSSSEAIYQYTAPQNMSFELIIDGTIIQNNSGDKEIDSVRGKVDDFMRLFNMHGDIHSPPYLKIAWGDMLWRGMYFDCVLSSVEISYTLFGKSGEPLRANLSVNFTEDLSDKKRSAIENKNSPDMTHIKYADSSTKLPFLASEVYQDPLLYMAVAEVNALDNFRSLKPGAKLTFPPLEYNKDN